MSDPPIRFDITEADIGRHVRQKSTGEIGIVRRDAGNGWLHPSVVYEWKGRQHDLEYVTVTPDRDQTTGYCCADMARWSKPCAEHADDPMDCPDRLIHHT